VNHSAEIILHLLIVKEILIDPEASVYKKRFLNVYAYIRGWVYHNNQEL